MKTCCTCKVEKDFSLFNKNKSTKDGFHKQCMSCLRAYYTKNKEQINKKNIENYFNNKEHRLKKNKQYRIKNKEVLILKKKEYYQNNKEMFKAKSRDRHRRIRKATPSWLSEKDRAAIQSIYNLARLYSWITGGEWQVDHIVPLKGKTVSGLHVPWNLEPVPKVYNLSKNNKF